MWTRTFVVTDLMPLGWTLLGVTVLCGLVAFWAFMEGQDRAGVLPGSVAVISVILGCTLIAANPSPMDVVTRDYAETVAVLEEPWRQSTAYSFTTESGKSCTLGRTAGDRETWLLSCDAELTPR